MTIPTAELVARLPIIASAIDSRPVMGHWEAMRCDKDAAIVRAAAAALEAMEGEIERARTYEAGLRAEVAGLRNAVKQFGSHINDCPRNLSQPDCDWELHCTCGFDAAIDGEMRKS
jgi:hypothetical protein